MDPQPARRVVHVCPDAAVGQAVASAAAANGLTCVRVDNGFAAAAELLARPNDSCLLLIALDSLSRPERPLLGWAGKRWPALPIWAYGSPARLNGHLADIRVKLVRIEQLAGLLAGLSLAADAGPPADAPADSPPAGQVAPAAEPEGRPMPAEPRIEAESVVDLATNAHVDEHLHNDAEQDSQPEAERTPPSQPDSPPAIRLRPADAGLSPTLTTEELALLLGPEEAGDN